MAEAQLTPAFKTSQLRSFNELSTAGKIVIDQNFSTGPHFRRSKVLFINISDCWRWSNKWIITFEIFERDIASHKAVQRFGHNLKMNLGKSVQNLQQKKPYPVRSE